MHNFKIGDKILFKTEHGKLIKLCEVIDTYSNTRSFYYYGNNLNKNIVFLKNLKAKKPEQSIIYANIEKDLIIPLPDNLDIENINLKTLIALYANKDVSVENLKFFEPTKVKNIQLNCENGEIVEEILQFLKKSYKIENVKTNNINIENKYIVKK